MKSKKNGIKNTVILKTYSSVLELAKHLNTPAGILNAISEILIATVILFYILSRSILDGIANVVAVWCGAEYIPATNGELLICVGVLLAALFICLWFTGKVKYEEEQKIN